MRDKKSSQGTKLSRINDFKMESINSFLVASERLVSEESNEKLEAQFANLLPNFHKRAASAEVEKLVSILRKGPFELSDCQAKTGSLLLSTTGNSVRCVLLAEAENEALLPAIGIWEEGTSEINPNPDYAKVLLEKQKGLGVFDFESFFAELQSDPREYFLQAQKRLGESELLNRPAIGKALGFLMEFIVQEDYQKFA